MKVKVVSVLLLGIYIIGHNDVALATTISREPNYTQKQYIISQNDLRIISSDTSVKRGGIGLITIHGKPNTLYNIKTSYMLANRTVSVIQWRTTDSTGVTTFNWVVSRETMSGTYDATISGGGHMIKTSHKVEP